MIELLTAIFLGMILILIFILPFLIKIIEKNLEIFLFGMGVITITVTWQWSVPLLFEALEEPIAITIAVLIAGILFRLIEKPLALHLKQIVNKIGFKVFIFLVILILGLLSSIITAIIAALILVAIVSHLGLDEKSQQFFVICACFSIGMGAVLTPIGEPLAVITIGKLSAAPYDADFWFLFDHLWMYIIPVILFLGILACRFVDKKADQLSENNQIEPEKPQELVFRTIKIYLFIMGLVFLGTGFMPLMDTIMTAISSPALYWINLSSAILDNATLAAAEIWPTMSLSQIVSALTALIIAGGILIPGNIPNIISAGKLKISSQAWARIGIPLGLGIMIVLFIILFL